MPVLSMAYIHDCMYYMSRSGDLLPLRTISHTLIHALHGYKYVTNSYNSHVLYKSGTLITCAVRHKGG